MQNKNYYNSNQLLFILITLMFTLGLFTDSLIFIIYYLCFIITVSILRILNKNIEEFIHTLIIFQITLLFGFILAFMVNSDFIENGVTFLYPDQMHFFEEARSLSTSNSVSELIHRAFYEDYRSYQLVYFIFGILAYLDINISGSVHFLPLLYSVVYVTALIPVFLYNVIKLYLPRAVSFKSSLFYGLFTPIMAYSGYLLRDMHITLITMIALFLMVRKVTIFRVLGIGVLIPITYQIREANSLLILAMLGIFIFAGKSSRNIKAVFIIMGVGFLFYFSNNISKILTSTGDRIEIYEDYTTESIEGSSGIGQYLYKLPPVVKEISISIFTLSTFPFTNQFSTSLSYQQFFMVLYNLVTNIGWYFIFFGVIFFRNAVYTIVFRKSNKTLFYLLVLFILYIATNTTNMSFRRLICVFPFIYVPFLLVYNDASNEKRKRFRRLALFTATSLYLIYFVLKF